MSRRIDLHTHTLHSDGRLTPAELLTKAVSRGVGVLAITDHDTTAGWRQAVGLPATPTLQIIPGIEVSAEGESACHLLGYWINPDAVGFESRLAMMREQRVHRMRSMIAKLATLGVTVSLERVQAVAGAATLGRPHLADVLVEQKVVRNRNQAFQKFLSREAPAYVPGESPNAKEAIALIRSAGGVPVLAHPSFYTDEAFIRTLAGYGLMGIEVYYPDTPRSLRERFLTIAKDLGLIATGGSDYHGPRTGRSDLACVEVPEQVLADLENARQRV